MLSQSIALLPILILVFSGSTVFIWFSVHAGIGFWARFESAFTQNTGDELQRLFVFADTQKILYGYVVAVVCVPLFVFYFFDSVFLFCAALITLIFLPKKYIGILQNRREREISDILPDILDQIAGSMLAGSTFTSAIQTMVDENSGPVKQEFSLMLREVRMGTGLEDALDNLAERVRSEDMDIVVSAATIARDVGGNLAETLSRLAESLRKKNEMEKKIKALTAQGILQGWVVSLLPFAILGALTFIEPEAVNSMFSSILGWLFLFVVVVLELIGGLFIRKIVRIDV